MKYDAIIILANKMDTLCRLNNESIERAKLAIKLINKYLIPIVITSGWAYRFQSKISIAEVLKKYLTKNGINSKKIMCEVASKDTVGDAIFSRLNIINKKKINKICIVTSSYHISRTKKIFKFIYGKKYKIDVVASDKRKYRNKINSEVSSLRAFRNTFKEVKIGDLDNLLIKLFERHPYYDGKYFK